MNQFRILVYIMSSEEFQRHLKPINGAIQELENMEVEIDLLGQKVKAAEAAEILLSQQK